MLAQATAGPAFVFFLSDGQASVDTAPNGPLASVADRPETSISAYQVGGSGGCDAGQPLGLIDAADGVAACTEVSNPSTLAAVLTAPRTGVSIVVTLNGDTGARSLSATVDPLGNWSATFQGVAVGSYSTEVVATFAETGETSRATRSFVVSSATGDVPHVALGDSYSSGEGYSDSPSDYDPDPLGQACLRAKEAWGRTLRLPANRTTAPAFVACRGAQTKHVLTRAQGVKGESNPVQLSSVSPGAGLVTLSIGGNDVFFSDVVASCGLGAGCWDNHFLELASGRRLTIGEFASLRLALVEPDITNTCRAVRASAGEETTVVAAGYPSLFGEGVQAVSFVPFGRRTCGEYVAFSKGERTKLNTASEKFDVRLARAARVAGVHYESVIDDFKGKRVCEGGDAGDEYLNGFNFTNKSPVVIADQGAFHPNRSGVAAYASAVSTFLSDHARTDPLTVWGLPENPEPQDDQATRSFQPAAYSRPSVVDSDASAAQLQAGPEPQVVRAVRVAYVAQVAPVAQVGQEVLAEVAADDLLLASLSDSERAELALATLTTVGLDLPESNLGCRAGTVPGSRVGWSGSGFAPGSTAAVTMAVDGVPRSLGTVVASQSGDAASAFVVPPPNAGFGDQGVVEGGLNVVGTNADGGHHSSNAVFLVDDPEGPCGQLLGAAGGQETTTTNGPTLTTTAAPGSSIGAGGAQKGRLVSRTGANIASWAAIAVWLMALGTYLVLRSRRSLPRRR